MIYRLQDTYDYQLPPLPPKEEILYWDKPKEEQYWRREDLDFEKINKTWTDEKKLKFVKREIKRRTYGIWIMVNGVPTYLTGSNYFFLQYFLVPVPEEEGTDFHSEEFQSWTQLVWSFADAGMMYPQYRDYQREFFYFLDLTAKDKYCEGGAVSKPRRVGITACFNADVLNLSMLKPQKNFSLMNKDRTDAINVNYKPIKQNIEYFPSVKLSNGKEIFRPKIAKLLISGSALFASPDEDKTDQLNTSIAVKSTVENANDGEGTYRIIRDEVSKYPPEVDISNMFFILRPVAKVGTRQVGKIYLFGTSSEKDTKNFSHWKNIYWDSDITTKIGDKTASGLYKYFISGKYALEGNVKDNGVDVELFDKYGKCKEDLAIREIANNIRPYKDAGDVTKVQALLRQFPIYENDPFDSTSQTNCFDSFRLNIQRTNVEEKIKRIKAGIEMPLYTRGKLEWVLRDKIVRFVPVKDEPTINDIWLIYRLPNERWKNKQYTDQYGFINPDDTSPYLWTGDPIDYRNNITEGSKTAIVVGCMLDSTLPHGGMTMDARCLFRTNNPNDVIENVRMAAVFWAAKGAPETNKAWLAIDMIKGRDDEQNQRPNYGRYMLTYDKDLKAFRQWNYGEQGIVGIFTGANSTEGYVRDGNIYLREPKLEGEIDRLPFLEDLELIKQLLNFDPLKTTKYDLAIAFLLWTMILKNYSRNTVPSTGLTDAMLIRAWFGVKEKPRMPTLIN